jgi:DNA replication protein DnaC
MGRNATAAPVCERCDGSGWKSIEVNGVSRATRCDCWVRKQRNWAEGVPFTFQAARLGNYREWPGNAPALKAAYEWLSHKRSDLFLVGGVGVGKTRLACTLLNEAFDAGEVNGLFVRVPYLMLLQLQGMDDGEKRADANALIDRCLEADPLCLDDIAGAEAASDFSRRVMVTLYDQRVDRGKRTIWTSNLRLSELATFYGDERLASRIAGQAREVTEICGDDQRLSDRW